MIFPFFKKIGFLGIFGPPSYGIGAIIRIGREMLCLPYAGFLKTKTVKIRRFWQFFAHISHLNTS